MEESKIAVHSGYRLSLMKFSEEKTTLRSHIKGANDSSIYQVVWDEEEQKLLASHAESFTVSAHNALTTHQIPVNVKVDHSASDLISPKVELHVPADTIIDDSDNLDSHIIGVDHGEEHIITEINSPDCETKKQKRKKNDGNDTLFINEDEKFEKITKFKKEKEDNVIRKRFSRNWYDIPEFSKWLEESPLPGYAFCNICRKDLLPGKSELLKHSMTNKHRRKVAAVGSGSKDDPMKQHIVDLRSDTVTVPNREMREAMKNAIVGDCAFGEDPTVQELEQKVAKLLNMEAALLVPSGTMGNLICVLAHCWSRGSLVILGDQSYMYRASQGSMSEIGNVSQRVVRNLPDGSFDLSDLKTILQSHGPSWPTTTLICVENTHTMMGGKALPLEWMENLGLQCAQYGIPIHLDGARLINASAALGVAPSRLTRHCSSATFCLNKGLGAPGGCVIAGNSDFIDRASVIRKSLGGVIHQAGFLAAACLYGLNNFISRISKDHSNAVLFAKAVCSVNSTAVTVDVSSVQTNIVHLICDNIRVNPEQLCQRLMKVLENEALEISEGIIVKCSPIPPNIVRIMTHGDLLMDDIKAAIKKIQYVISEYDNFFVIEYCS